MELAGHQVVVSCSVGVSVIGSGTAPSSLADLVREADAAMYRAKANGRNRWERLDRMQEKPQPRYSSVRSATTDASWAFTGSTRLGPKD
jgi:predicted signal transduction protein with EAL and GGDEF domain